jgi:hypothetical protein
MIAGAVLRHLADEPDLLRRNGQDDGRGPGALVTWEFALAAGVYALAFWKAPARAHPLM